MIRILFIVSFVLNLNSAFSQEITIQNRIQFLSKLNDETRFREAVLFAQTIDSLTLNKEEKDSLNYLSAWGFYQTKKTLEASKYFDRVSKQSPNYFKSKFYSNYCEFYTFKDSLNYTYPNYNFFNVNDSLYNQLAHFQLSGMYLYRKEFNKFDSIKAALVSSPYFINEQNNFLKIREEYSNRKKKSPVVAGLLSVVLPGSGKFYAGYRGKALSSFAPCLAFAAFTVESYYRSGVKSFPFIAFGSLFALFYTANIYAGIISVKQASYEFDQTKKHEILLDLHIPLRRIFN